MLTVEECLIDGQGGLDLSVIDLDILHNHVTHGTVAIRSPSLNVRIRDNRMEDSAGHGVTLRGSSIVDQVEIHRNEIWRARRNGIGIDGGDNGPIAYRVTIAHNRIMACVSPNAPAGSIPAGGVILGRAGELEIRDNRIADNGAQVAFAVCGIYVLRSWGVEITRN